MRPKSAREDAFLRGIQRTLHHGQNRRRARISDPPGLRRMLRRFGSTSAIGFPSERESKRVGIRSKWIPAKRARKGQSHSRDAGSKNRGPISRRSRAFEVLPQVTRTTCGGAPYWSRRSTRSPSLLMTTTRAARAAWKIPASDAACKWRSRTGTHSSDRLARIHGASADGSWLSSQTVTPRRSGDQDAGWQTAGTQQCPRVPDQAVEKIGSRPTYCAMVPRNETEPYRGRPSATRASTGWSCLWNRFHDN